VWSHLAARGVVATKMGGLMRTLEYRGHDFSAKTREEHVALLAHLNRALGRLGPGWSLHVEARRSLSTDYRLGTHGPACARLVDAARRQTLARSGRTFTTTYFLTLSYERPQEGRGTGLLTRLTGLFGGLFSGGEQAADGVEADRLERAKSLEAFERTTRQFVGALGSLLPEVRWLGDDEVCTYLHSCVGLAWHPVRAPSVPMYLDAVLCSQDVELGLSGRIGAHHLGVVSIKGYPQWTYPGMTRALEALPFECRVVTRFLGLGHEESLGTLSRRRNVFESASGALIGDRVDQTQAAAARATTQVWNQVKTAEVSMGYHSASVVVWSSTQDELRERVDHVLGRLRVLGFAAVEERANLRGAWFATHPGNTLSNPRRALVTSKNLAHLMPVYGTWTGADTATHTQALGQGQPPLVYCKGTAGEPERFGLNLNLGDVGHTMILGPTGAGKSTLLLTLVLAWLKYERAQVVIFDKDRSSRATTLCAGGRFIDLSSGGAVAFAPLRRLHEPAQMEFAMGFVERLFAGEGVAVGVDVRSKVRRALAGLLANPPHMRTLGHFAIALSDMALRRALAPYCHDGAYARLFDAQEDRLELEAVTALELGGLMDSSPRIVALVLDYLFWRVEERFDGRPSLLVLDEAWLFLAHPQFAERLDNWLRTLRKKNVYVVFATQNVIDAVGSPIAPTLMQNCPTRLLLPNLQASAPTIAPAYRELGLSDAQIARLSKATPKREYLYSSPLGSRLFELGLTRLELAIVGASAPADHRLIDDVERECAATGEDFLNTYLRARGLDPAAFLGNRG
jgi:type IV secretion system protein VirB4